MLGGTLTHAGCRLGHLARHRQSEGASCSRGARQGLVPRCVANSCVACVRRSQIRDRLTRQLAYGGLKQEAVEAVLGTLVRLGCTGHRPPLATDPHHRSN